MFDIHLFAVGKIIKLGAKTGTSLNKSRLRLGLKASMRTVVNDVSCTVVCCDKRHFLPSSPIRLLGCLKIQPETKSISAMNSPCL